MTDQPSDHRAEAEQWLETAKRWPDDKQLLAITDALIGIGHYLGAILEVLLALGPGGVELGPDGRYRAKIRP